MLRNGAKGAMSLSFNSMRPTECRTQMHTRSTRMDTVVRENMLEFYPADSGQLRLLLQ